MYKSGEVSGTTLQQSETDLAEARIELLKAQRSAEDQDSGGVVRELNNELSKLVVQSAEIEAKQKSLEQIYAELHDALMSSFRGGLERVEVEARLESLRRRMFHIEESLTDLQSQGGEPGGEITIRSLEEALLGDEP
jgi:predicted transcriptional regulator